MRALACTLLVALAGCPQGGDTCSDTGGSCSGGLTCTRDGECLDPSQVRAVKVTWTIGGMPASATTCASTGDFLLQFLEPSGGSFGYEPVPCVEGQFTIDRIPTRFVDAEIGVQVQPIGTDNSVAFDLPP